jgi:lipopolysaccharide export system permease protein
MAMRRVLQITGAQQMRGGKVGEIENLAVSERERYRNLYGGCCYDRSSEDGRGALRLRWLPASVDDMIGLTLGRYLSGRFLEQILIVFLSISALSFLIDFVEMLRRSGDTPVGAGFVALMSFLRVPVASEQILPFAVMFGTMAAFINLTRKLELVVARASGISVWGFLVPPLALALVIGLGSVVVYNPMAAAMKQRADEMEIEAFGRPGTDKDAGIWLRHRSVDGKATIRAERVADKGTRLEKVVAYLDDPYDHFLERIDAPAATLTPGAWKFDQAKVVRPGEEAQEHKVYYLATDMNQADVMRSLMTPDSIPFWRLPEFRDRTEEAGLDANVYALRYQTLLARPLMLIAMVLIAAAFSLRFFRFGGVGRMVAGGVAAGFVLYVATKMVGDMGGAGLLSAPIAAWSPALVGSLLGALALLHQEDG